MSGELARWDSKLIWALPETACSADDEDTPLSLFVISGFYRIEDRQIAFQGHRDASVTGSRRHR